MKASKQKFGRSDLKRLFDGATRVVVSKGRKSVDLDPREVPPGSSPFAALVLGPTGNLRAPAARVGKRWLVGFHEDAWSELLG